MSSSEIVPQSATVAFVKQFEKKPETINVDSVAMLHRAAAKEGDAFLEVRDRLNEIVDAMPEDRRVAIATESSQFEEESYTRYVAPYAWIRNLFANSIERTLKARRIENGAKKIAIPNPHLLIELEAQYDYDKDPYALELIAKDLPEDEAAKLVTVVEAHIEPERTVVVPAREVPRQVIAGNTTAILAIANKYAGTPIATAIEAALGRKVVKEVFTFRPRAKKPATKTVGPA